MRIKEKIEKLEKEKKFAEAQIITNLSELPYLSNDASGRKELLETINQKNKLIDLALVGKKIGSLYSIFKISRKIFRLLF